MHDEKASSLDPASILKKVIEEKPAQHSRRKTDKANYSIDDFDKAVQVLKKIDEVDTKSVPSVEAIEAVTELEDVRLRNWVVKLLGYTLIFIVVVIISAIVYSTITGNDISVPNFVSGTFSTLKDIVTAIIETKG